MIDLVIFDCDGVLVDSEGISAITSQAVLADLGWQLSIDEIVRRFVGSAAGSMEAQIEEHLGRPLEPDWSKQYARWYRDAFERDLKPIAGVEPVLAELTLPFCVASNSSHTRIRHMLELVDLFGYFEGAVFSADDVERGKPAPDVFLHAAKVIGADPSRCLVIEDSRFGATAARRAGMEVLGYAGGLTPAEWLHGPNTTVFDSMDELPGLIARRL
ncbi:MAG TPA: HAD family phosphatase [Microbacteriaceae bacterium]